jgi:hypothetical protein
MGQKIRIQKFIIAFFVALLCIASFIIGIYQNPKANSSASSSILPFAKGGTGANNIVQARANLKTVNKISNENTDEEAPTAKAIYTFGYPLYNFGSVVATGTFSNTYFDFYYEKYGNNTVKLTINNSQPKATIPVLKNVLSFSFPAAIKPVCAKNQVISPTLLFYDSSGSKIGQAIFFTWCGASASVASMTFTNPVAINTSATIISTPIIYQTS